jgi:hypothetical protein
MGYLLTLDLSSRNCGWTCGEPYDERFAYGSQPFLSTGDDIGAFGERLHRWLMSALKGVDCCCFEAPILWAGRASLPVLRKLYGAAYHVETVCKMRRIRCFEADNLAVKRFIGIPRGGDPKKAMIQCIRRYGYEPADADAADAIGIRLYVIARMFPEAAKAFGLELGLLGAAAANG